MAKKEYALAHTKWEMITDKMVKKDVIISKYEK